MKKIISALILVLLLSSCVTRRACERWFANDGIDSINSRTNTITVIRDTTIFIRIPGDTLNALLPVSEESRLNTSLGTSIVSIENGKINHRLEQKDTSIETTLKGALKSSSTYEQKERINIKTRYINQLTGWQWIQVYLGRVFLGALAAIILWNILKRNLIKV